MPGIEFRPGGPPKYHPPPRGFKEGLRALGDAGMGFVVLHQAAAAWPTWPEWARFVGAQFLYSPRKSFGEALPDSRYLLEVSHRVSPLIEHPVTQGIEPFTLTDELHLWPGPQEPVTPIFASDFSFEYQNFYSAAPPRARWRGISSRVRTGRIHRAAISSAGSRPTDEAPWYTCSLAMAPRPTRMRITESCLATRLPG